MQFYYGEQMPLRILDEADFWKMQEKEHTVVIREIAPNLEEEYVLALKKWEEAFGETKGMVVAMIETVIRSKGNISPQTYQKIMELISFSNKQSQQFVVFLNHMLKNSKAIAKNMVARTVISHIIRESQYYIGISNAILSQ